MTNELPSAFAQFNVPQYNQQVIKGAENPINSQKSSAVSNEKSDTQKVVAGIAAAAAISALAVAAIKLGPKVFKKKPPKISTPPVSNPPTRDAGEIALKGREVLTKPLEKLEEVVQTSNAGACTPISSKTVKNGEKIENPVEFFKEKLAKIFSDKEGINFDDVSDVQVLKNGNKKLEHTFVDAEGIEHRTKLLLDKDNNFVSIYEKQNGKREEYSKRSLVKYNSNGRVDKSASKATWSDSQLSFYDTDGKHFLRERNFSETGKICSEKLTDKTDYLNPKLLSETNYPNSISGNRVKIITDHTQGEPVEYIQTLGKKITQEGDAKVFQTMEDGSISKYYIDSYHHDASGKILSKSQTTAADCMWEINPKPINLNENLDIVPAKCYVRKGKSYFEAYGLNAQNSPELNDFLVQNSNLTLDSKDLKLFEGLNTRPYDVPERFAAIANNTAAKNGSALIYDEVPKVFEGIEPKEIQKALDRYSVAAHPFGTVSEFEIAGKKLRATMIGSGQIGMVYKIEDAAGNAVALKKFKDPYLLGLQSGYAEIPVARQLTKDGVTNVPKFYMANPINRPVEINNRGSQGEGGWMISDFISGSTPQREGKQTFAQWLKEHGLIFGDYNAGSKVGDYIVDIGGVIGKADKNGYIRHLDDVLLPSYNVGLATPDLAKALQG